MSLSVVIPAYNEAATINRVITSILELPFVQEVIVVNDCSTDATGRQCDEAARRNSRVRVVHHPKNAGKTEALKTGFAMTTGDIVIVQDADLEYDPKEIFSVIQPIIDNHADVVYGSRFMVKKTARVLYFYHYLANKGLTFLSNLFTNLNISDVETCYKAFRGDIIRAMKISSRGFGFEIEVTAKIAKLRCAVYEVPISYYGRTYEDGKKIGFTDGVAALWFIVKYNAFYNVRNSFRTQPTLVGSMSYRASVPTDGSDLHSSDAELIRQYSSTTESTR
jgi:glycosyltransferase involved in cell wall biosynthesis